MTIRKKNKPLNHPMYQQALVELGNRDKDLKVVLSTLGPPPFWKRSPGFPAIVQIILEQQVSLSSARAAFQKLTQAVVLLTPESFLKLDGYKLKEIGFSRQKALYCQTLAEAIQTSLLNLEALKKMDDDQARGELIKIKGIGPWTADVYLLTALRRPNIWPVGDLALATAVQRVKKLKARPSPEEMEEMSTIWEPWRAVAARIFWHHYLAT
ncbi:MAG: DNA-3-methyladenine glycosylase 2 family protein [Thermodesulfobacteriota bacterium]